MMNNNKIEMNGNNSGKQIKNGGPPRKCYSIEVNNFWINFVVIYFVFFFLK
jgi:hypothetical protein